MLPVGRSRRHHGIRGFIMSQTLRSDLFSVAAKPSALGGAQTAAAPDSLFRPSRSRSRAAVRAASGWFPGCWQICSRPGRRASHAALFFGVAWLTAGVCS